MPETRHDTYSGMHTVYSSSGREWFFEARSGDTISLEITKGGGYYGTVNFCINLMSPESNDQSNRGQGKDLKDLNLEQETAESDSLKRPRGSDPNDTEEESPDLVILTAKDVPNETNSTSFPSTKNFFPIFSRKPLIFFKATPPKFSAEPKANEVKVPPKKKTKPKAKKLKPKTGKETTNTITNYFGASAAANNNNTSNPRPVCDERVVMINSIDSETKTCE